MKEIIEKLEKEKEKLEEEKNRFTKELDEINLKISKLGDAINILKDSKEVILESKEKNKPIARKSYPKEMYKFIKDNMEENGNIELCKKIEEELGLEIIPTQLASYMTYNKLKRKNRIYGIRMKSKQGIIIDNSRKPRVNYPEEMEDFVKDNLHLSNEVISKKVNKKFGIDTNQKKICDYLRKRNIKRKFIDEDEKTETKKKVVKKIGRPKKYADEVVQFLEENINNFKNKELCEELENRFNIKTDPNKLGMILCNKGIKRDTKEETHLEIIKFIKKSKTKDVYTLRDEIIEKFEKDIPTGKLKELMKRKDLPGEGVKDEVKRIEEISKLESIDNESIDDMDLD